MKVIACGNLECGDDAAGILVAQRLREWGIDAREAISLFDAWDAGDDVVMVDAMSSGRELGAVAVWEGTEVPELQQFRASTHDLGLAEMIGLRSAARNRVRGHAPQVVWRWHLSAPGPSPLATMAAALPLGFEPALTIH